MAREHKKWRAALQKDPCNRCGYLESAAAPNTPAPGNQCPSNTYTYAGPSAQFPRADVLTPVSQESAMEERLLIGSESGSRYGTVECNEHSEPIVEQPEEVVVCKGKKKKKAVNSKGGSRNGLK